METQDKVVLGLGGIAIAAAVIAANRSSDGATAPPSNSTAAPPSNPTPATTPSLRPNIPLTPPTSPALNETWYRDTLDRLRLRLDALGAAPADDQYWRAVFFLNHARSSSGGFTAPTDMDRSASLRYVSDLVFALPVRGAGNVIPLRVDDARISDFLRAAKLSPIAWLSLSSSQKRQTITRVRPSSAPERVISAIDAYALRARSSLRLRPAGDASSTQETPWGLLALFGVGFVGLETLRRTFARNPRRNPGLGLGGEPSPKIAISPSLAERLSHWYSGQGDPIYSLASTGHGTYDTIDRALTNLYRSESDLQRQIDQYRLSGRLGAVRDSAANLKQLRRLTRELEQVALAAEKRAGR